MVVDSNGNLQIAITGGKGGGVTPVWGTNLGDDCTDEAAFRAVNKVAIHSLSVLVRNQWHETAADLWLRPPGELRGFLEDWFRALERCW